ncbi:hypothetical protein [Ochrobactrum sp. SFR4]|uniref:hypothetical protein n=1 Tax=Ochrobactrum sp. SFR4 TaxID=2717368 RepID=UPI001C8B760A|nr:hypothetical protein [Ochrobactrum sp. SFR4]
MRNKLPVQLELPLSGDTTLRTFGIYWWEKGDGNRLKPANSNDPFALDDNYSDQN